MLQIRLEGDADEARAFLDALAVGGAEVQVGTTKNRGAFSHVYAVVRMPGYNPAPAGAGAAATGQLAVDGHRTPRRRR